MNKFGKNIRIEVYDSSGLALLKTSNLRIDFDVRLLQGYNRAQIGIFNLNATTIKEISNGERYVSIYTSIHGGPETAIIDNFYVNNAFTEKKVPDSVTTLFCIDKLRKGFTSKQAKIELSRPSLSRYLEALKQFSEEGVQFVYKDFPPELENYVPVRPLGVFSGEVDDALKMLAKEYGFTYHMKPNNIIDIIYRPLSINVHQTKQDDRAKIVLLTSRMRSNPIVGVVQLQIESNLDERIECGTLLDTSQLMTAAVEEDLEVLVVDKGYLNSSVSGYSVYKALSVNHLGSSHTNLWTTKVIAYKAAKGTHINRYNWFG